MFTEFLYQKKILFEASSYPIICKEYGAHPGYFILPGGLPVDDPPGILLSTVGSVVQLGGVLLGGQ